MQVPHCVHTEIQEEEAVWTDKARAGTGAEAAGGTHDGRPHPHADVDTAEAQRVAGGWVHQGEEHDMDSALVRREAEIFQRAAYVGAGIFRVHGGS